MLTPDVELVAVTKIYAGRVLAVDTVSLAVQKGEFVALVGPSGCGKTTLLRMIAGFIQPTAGEIRIQGRDVVSMPIHRRNTAMVFQNYALFPHMNVWKNVAFGVEMRRVRRYETTERVKRALELVHLPEFGERYPRQLSGGQQQRIALARALVTEPLVLLLDEPLSNLDARLRQEMRDELRELQRQLGITTIFVTHDQQEALAMADRVVVMSAGHIEQVGSPSGVYARPTTRFVAQFIGDANFIEGTVTHIDGAMVQAIHHSGVLLAGRGEELLAGEPAWLVIRPETVRILDEKESDLSINAVPATIESLTYLGGRVLLRANSAIGSLRVLADARDLQSLERGSTVRLRWKQDDVVVLRR